MKRLYFSYGSNMSLQRLSKRISSTKFMNTARLYEYELKFHKKSYTKSGKCDVAYTGNEEHVVHGVVFEIDEDDKKALDGYEGCGSGYEEKTVTLELPDGEKIEAFTYYATNIDPSLRPFHWYKEHVVRGAKEHGLPDDYVRLIEQVESFDDPDKERHIKEMSIYND